MLALIREDEIDPIRADGGLNGAQPGDAASSVATLLRKRSLLIFTSCIFLFHAANAAMLPLVGAEMTVRSGPWATALVAACIVLPQLVVALIAPGVGRLAVTKGRRPVLIAGFAVLPVRAAILALYSDPVVIIAVQMLDGHERGRAGRPRAVVAGRHLPRHGPLQSGAGHRRQRNRHWGRREHGGGRLSCGPIRHLRRVCGPRGSRLHVRFFTVLLAMPETSPELQRPAASEPK